MFKTVKSRIMKITSQYLCFDIICIYFKVSCGGRSVWYKEITRTSRLAAGVGSRYKFPHDIEIK